MSTITAASSISTPTVSSRVEAVPWLVWANVIASMCISTGLYWDISWHETIGHRFIAEGDYVVVEARGNNTTKTGKPYNNAYCFVIRLHDGKLKEITEYMDTELVTATLGDTAA